MTPAPGIGSAASTAPTLFRIQALEEVARRARRRRGFREATTLRTKTQNYLHGEHTILRFDLNRYGYLTTESWDMVMEIAMDALPIDRVTTVWRGYANTGTTFTTIKKGSLIGEGLPTSTSFDSGVAARFGHLGQTETELDEFDVIAKIEVPKGTNGIITNPEEAEFLLGWGYKIHVDKVEKNIATSYISEDTHGEAVSARIRMFIEGTIEKAE